MSRRKPKPMPKAKKPRTEPFTSLAAERLNLGLSIRQAALEIGIARATLERAERGEGVHPGSALRIAKFYDCKVTDFVDIGEEREAA